MANEIALAVQDAKQILDTAHPDSLGNFTNKTLRTLSEAVTALSKPDYRKDLQSLSECLRRDPGYSWRWHKAIVDSSMTFGCDEEQASKIAAKFLKDMLDVEVKR